MDPSLFTSRRRALGTLAAVIVLSSFVKRAPSLLNRWSMLRRRPKEKPRDIGSRRGKWVVLFAAWTVVSLASDAAQSRSQGDTSARSVLVAPYGEATGEDLDKDGVSDAAEATLAERFAPILIHDRDDPNLPTNVDWLLRRVTFEVHDKGSGPQPIPVQRPFTQSQLNGRAHSIDGRTVFSDGSLSRTRTHTFVLNDVPEGSGDRKGSLDSRDWTTYVHSYRNDSGGVTIQYWRLHAYNTGDFTKQPPIGEIAHHGGDWESSQVVLDQTLKPLRYVSTGHTSIEIVSADDRRIRREGDHWLVYSEPGGHAGHVIFDLGASYRHSLGPVTIAVPFWSRNLTIASNTIRHETASSGSITWPRADWRSHIGGVTTPAGRLVNVGEKMHPLNGQVFVRYSGLWGSIGRIFSGYWGPAYNETEEDVETGFIKAWCFGIAPDAPDRTNECLVTDRW